MVEILPGRPNLRRADEDARRLIDRNRGTITKLADQLSNGAYSAARQAAADPGPQASGKTFIDLGSSRPAGEPRPYVRVSPNRRVTVVDYETNRQMHYLGEIRRLDGRLCFVLTSKANGFSIALDPDVAARLQPLDGAVIGPERTEAALSAEIGALLGYT